MKKNLTQLILVAIMAILPLSIFAQKKKTVPVEKYFYVSAEGGLSINHTDLADYGGVAFYQHGKFTIDNYLFHNFDGKIGIGYQFGKVIGLNAKFGTARIAGEHRYVDKEKADRLVAIEDATNKAHDFLKLDQANPTKFMEGNLNLTFNLFNLFFGYNPRRVFNIVPHVGVGGIFYHAGAVMDSTNTVVAAAKTGAREKALTVPVGAEFTFNVARKLDFFVDYTYTFATKDNLDQVRKVKELTNQVSNDMYSSLNLGLRLKFNKKPCDIEGMAARSNEIGMRTNPEQLAENDGKVCFDVIFDVPAEYFEKEAVMNVTPTMSYKGGQVTLEPVTFVGEKVKENGDFRVNYKTGGQFTKNYCMDFVPGMEEGTLSATPMFYVYDGNIYPTQDEIAKNAYFAHGGDHQLANGVSVPVIICEVNDLNTKVEEDAVIVTWSGEALSYDLFITQGNVPDENTPATVAGIKETTYTFTGLEPGTYHIFVKANCKYDRHSNWQQAPDGAWQQVTDGEWQQASTVEIVPTKTLVCTFFFDYNSSELRSSTKMNRQAVKALASRLASGEPFTEIIVEGWASPEGEYQLNNNLADDRAKAAETTLKNQLKKVKLDPKNFNFNVKGFGPDWDKFVELVQNSNIKDKDQIVRVIQSSKNREKEIKNMINVYPELERDILPLIRRAEVYVK